MHENTIATYILDCAVEIHKVIGPGLLETAYETLLEYEVKAKGLKVARQVHLDFTYKSLKLKKVYIADLIIQDLVILEIKSQESNKPLHRMQLLTYLKLTNKRLGLLLNFGMSTMKDGVIRVVNNL